MTIPNTPLSRKDLALNLLDEIKIEIENDEINNAALQLAQLTGHISEWQNSENLKNARTWLDSAFESDLLSFDATIARDYLQKWQGASDSEEENPELADYRKRVESRARQKNEALLIRGVISHSNEIIEEAKTLEIGAEPPAPTFMMRQYYDKVQGIVLAAQADYEKNPELVQLVQRVERLHDNKETASSIFSMALESQKYSNALNNLEQLPGEFLVPRFTATEDVSGEKRLTYQGMVQIPIAREEITTQAKTWATKVVSEAMATAQRYLDAHEPQESVDELQTGENVEKFLEAEQKAQLDEAKTLATTQLRNREKAEERAEKALEIAKTDAVMAWDEYVAGFQLYQWADGLDEARQATLKEMRSNLKAMAQEADVTFHEARNMDAVREICNRAKAHFSNKDESLNELLQQFDEFEDMIESYREYITAGNEIISRVKETIWDDAVAANDFLTQIESYPDFVLQAFDELYDLRVQVNQRLNADQTYNQLYKALFNETMPEITEAIEHTNVASGEFIGDERFPRLELWLKYHMAFISAAPHFKRGSYEQVLQLIAPVLNQPQHPDYEVAIKMSQTIQTANQGNSDTEGE